MSLFHKQDKANRIYATNNIKAQIKASALPDVWNIFQENYFFLHIHIKSHRSSRLCHVCGKKFRTSKTTCKKP